MPPFKQARQEHREEILAEGGQPPENFKTYKEGITEWAKSVGWR